METLKVTKYEELNKFATELNKHGFSIISYYDKNEISFNSYFNFHKDGYFGYVQKDGEHGEYSLTTVNKPCSNYGTGHRYATGGSDILTIENANKCLIHSKHLIERYEEIKNYSSLYDFFKSPINSAKTIID